MTALYIILGIILFVLILLLLPVSIKAKFEKEENSVFVRYAFVSFKLYPKEEKKKHKAKLQTQAGTQKKKGNTLSNAKKTLSQLGDFLKGAAPGLKAILKKFTLSFDISVTVGGENPAVTGITCGAVNAAAGVAWAVCENSFKLGQSNIHIEPALDSKESFITGYVNLKIKSLFLLSGGVRTFLGIAAGQN